MAGGNSTTVTGDGEAPPTSPTADNGRQGGWSTTYFIIASFAGLTLAGGGWMNNLIVLLINKFNIKSINAAQINNVVIGTSNFFPVIAAILADSFLGCFSVIWISSLISLLGLILLVLTVTVDALRPHDSSSGPSDIQYTALFSALALVTIGVGGTRFTVATMGANQFSTKPQHQASFFNWYFFTLYFANFTSATGIVYVEENVSWIWGFGICIAANLMGLLVFLFGKRYYCCERRRGSPFTALARVIVASVWKRKVKISSQTMDYYYGDDEVKRITNSFRSLNRAALKTEGDILPSGLITRPWKLCSVQQVEDLKTVIRILPLWSTSILLATPIAIQASLTVLQVLTTNRHLGGHRNFQVPAGSMIVFSLISTITFLTLSDHCLHPIWRKFSGGRNPTPFQQIGIGHVFNISSMAISAVIESKRRGHIISVLWLVPQLVIVGVGEAFHFPGQMRLYYQEFPVCLKSMATAMIAMLIGVAFYLSTAVIDFVRRVTEWLPDDIDDGRLDYVYWVLVVLGIINFVYYLVCSWFYECKSDRVVEEEDFKNFMNE